MNFLDGSSNDILLLADSIINRKYKKDEWRSVLDSLSKMFNVDGAFIGFWEEGYIKLKYSSSLIKSYQSIQSSGIDKVNIKDRQVFKDALLEEGYIKINDYENYGYALKEWKEIGLKSLLAVTIKTQKKVYGSLHLVKLKEKTEFNDIQIKTLKIVADTIASELEKDALTIKLKQERDVHIKYVKLINSITLDSELSTEFNLWISNTLSKIKNVTNADMLSFVMPSENIYTKLNNVFSQMSYNEFRENPLYDLWENNIDNVVVFSQSNQLDKCSVPYIKKAVAIPIVSSGKTIAVLCLGFRKDISSIQNKVVLLTKTVLKYFTSLIYTYKNITRMSSMISDTEEGLIKSFVSFMEVRDVYTKGHSEHVATYAKNIGRELGLNEDDQESLYHAGIMHDIGKIGIPDNILLKPGKLTPHEYEIMKLHPIFSYEIIKSIPKFKKIANCVKHHHERVDGSGYPDGLKGNKIELGARILAIADIFDALTTQRPYRSKLTPKEAIEILKKEPVDLDILLKTEDVLERTYIEDSALKSTFVPLSLEKIKKDMIKRDYMTGLYRRDVLAEALQESIKKREEVVLFMVDIKNISYINYKYGVDAGDRVIVFVAEELRKMGDISMLAKTGVDIFMFIYKGKNPADFKNVISKKLKKGILERIGKKSCVIDKKEADKIIGCYIVYAQYPKEASTAEELIYVCLKKKKELYVK